MTWQVYEVVLKLRTPLHVGWSKNGNLQRTRPYLTGRNLWGALTERLTRLTSSTASEPTAYELVGKTVNTHLTFTYFYPALRVDGHYLVQWPWNHPDRFAARHLGSYASTAVVGTAQVAAHTTLHEIEYVAPTTTERVPRPVYLMGYVFALEPDVLDWQDMLPRLQFGGERTYGWGAVTPERVEPVMGDELFGGCGVRLGPLDGERPVLTLEPDALLLAHTAAGGLELAGQIEPVVGRAWPLDRPSAGTRVQLYAADDHLCFMPGGRSKKAATVAVLPFGLWRATTTGAA